MSHIWTFSPSSEPYLKRCIAAALLQETDNQWTRKFGRTNVKLLSENLEKETATEVFEVPPSPVEQEKIHVSVNYDSFFDSIENEVRLDDIIKNCSENPDLILKMAERLTLSTVEKLFNQVFSNKDVEIDFLTALIHIFLPAYIKKQYSWLCIDLLTKTNELYPQLFPKLLKILFGDLEIPNQVLNNYVTTLSVEKNTIFLNCLSNIELSAATFAHNILIIYAAYKDCIKSSKIQEYIKTILLKYSRSSTADRNYGRLFLAYLQSERSMKHTVQVRVLEECLEMHRSPFKRPCLMLLKEFVDE